MRTYHRPRSKKRSNGIFKCGVYRNPPLYPTHSIFSHSRSPSGLITHEVITGNDRPELRLLHERRVVVPHALAAAHLLARLQELRGVEVRGLLVQHEDVAVGGAGRWRTGRCVRGDRGSGAGCEDRGGAVGGLGGGQAWLDPWMVRCG